MSTRNIWLSSDHHFSHANILTFLDKHGNLTRPGFANVEEMNELMIERWNECVKPGDKIYHLGDIVCTREREMSKAIDSVLPRLNGVKRICLGNHDAEVPTLVKHIKKVMLWRLFKDEGFICSHLPMRPEQFRHKVVLNVHGHLHQNIISDPRYFNVCVENHDYRPVHIDEVLQRVRIAREAAIESEFEH